MNKKKVESYTYAIGRRKRSTARIRLHKGKGQTLVNDLPISEYFRGIYAVSYLKPFDITKTTGKYYVTARIEGGGTEGQVGAFIHGISRALVKENPEEFKPLLRAANLLTRDPRERERRKFGNAQKARARKQSPKR